METHPAMRLPNRDPHAPKYPTHSIAVPPEAWDAAYQRAATELAPQHVPSMTALITNLLAAWAAGESF